MSIKPTQRAGLLFLAKTTSRILLILENGKWTLPTFIREGILLADANVLMESYSTGKIVPIELYLSQDKGFEYGTYVCLVDHEFLVSIGTFAWCDLACLPSHLHTGLKTTLGNSTIRVKIETILELAWYYT
jgi:hypothetical protein